MCTQDCPRPAGPDADRDARVDAYRDRERRKVSRALDRLLDVHLNGGSGTAYADVANERLVEAFGDYVLARLGGTVTATVPGDVERVEIIGYRDSGSVHQKAHYGVADQLDPNGLVPDCSPADPRDLPDGACLRLTERAEYCPAAGSPRCLSCTWRPAAGE
jgi:hypothetical protein